MCLGEYKLAEYGGCDVYTRVGGYVYLYRTHTAWYCSGEIGREDGKHVFIRNINTSHTLPTDGWEYNKYWSSQSAGWVPAPSLAVSRGHLPQCVITVHGGGDVDGEYKVDPGQCVLGRYGYRQTVEPFCTLSVDVNDGYGWCVYNRGIKVMRSKYPSICPADPLCEYGVGDSVGGCRWMCYKKKNVMISDSDYTSNNDSDIDRDDDSDDGSDDVNIVVNVHCNVHSH